MNTPSVPSAAEKARRIVDWADAGKLADDEWLVENNEDAIITVARALLTACEALEPFAKVDLSSLFSNGDNEPYVCIIAGSADAHDFTRQDVLRARAALSCSAPPSEKQGG